MFAHSSTFGNVQILKAKKRKRIGYMNPFMNESLKINGGTPAEMFDSSPKTLFSLELFYRNWGGNPATCFHGALLTLMILSPGCSPCCAAGLPGWTAVTKIPLSLPPVKRIPTEPSFWKLINRGSGLNGFLFIVFLTTYSHLANITNLMLILLFSIWSEKILSVSMCVNNPDWPFYMYI